MFTKAQTAQKSYVLKIPVCTWTRHELLFRFFRWNGTRIVGQREIGNGETKTWRWCVTQSSAENSWGRLNSIRTICSTSRSSGISVWCHFVHSCHWIPLKKTCGLFVTDSLNTPLVLLFYVWPNGSSLVFFCWYYNLWSLATSLHPRWINDIKNKQEPTEATGRFSRNPPYVCDCMRGQHLHNSETVDRLTSVGNVNIGCDISRMSTVLAVIKRPPLSSFNLPQHSSSWGEVIMPGALLLLDGSWNGILYWSPLSLKTKILFHWLSGASMYMKHSVHVFHWYSTHSPLCALYRTHSNSSYQNDIWWCFVMRDTLTSITVSSVEGDVL